MKRLLTIAALVMGVAICSANAQTWRWRALTGSNISSVGRQNCNNTGSPSYCTGVVFPYSDNLYAVVNAWSGAVARTKAGSEQMLVFGGGHNVSFDNSVYAVNLFNSTATALTNPSVPSGSASPVTVTNTTCQDPNPDGTPPSIHSYGQMVYLSQADKLWLWDMAKNGYCNGGGPAPTNYAWLFDPATTKTWTVGNNSGTINLNTSQAAICALDTSFGVTSHESVVCYVLYSGGRSLVRWDSVTNTWSTLKAYGTFNAGYGVSVAVDPVRKIMMIIGLTGDPTGTLTIGKIDLSNTSYTYTDLTSGATGCSALGVVYPGLAYDSVTGGGNFMAWPNAGNTVYEYNPDTNACTAHTATGGPPNNTTQGTFGRFAAFPTLGAFAVVNAVGNPAYLFDIATPPTISSTSPITAGATSSPYTYMFTATGSTPIAWTMTGTVPGLALNVSTGVLSGTPTTAGVYTLNVTATNGEGADSHAFTLVIGVNGLGGSSLTCIDRDGDGYGTGPVAMAQRTNDLSVVAIPNLSAPPAPTVTVQGTPGTKTYYYYVSSCTKIGNSFPCTLPSTGTAVTTSANSSFSGTNYNRVQWVDQFPSSGWASSAAQYYQILRTTTSTPPSGTGSYQPIGGFVAAATACSAGTCTFNDTDVLQRTQSVTVALSSFVQSASYTFVPADEGRSIHITAGLNQRADYTICGTSCGYAISGGIAAVSSTTTQDTPGKVGDTGGTWGIDGCIGPDADDLDASIRTWPEAKAKYGSFSAFLARPNGPGYSPSAIYYLAPAVATSACLANLAAGEPASSCVGNNSTGVANDPTHPFATWAGVSANISAGRMVVMRDGFNDMISPGSGATNNPIIFYAFPGEIPVFDSSQGVNHFINTQSQSWITIDGLRGQNGGCPAGGEGLNHQPPYVYHDIVFRHVEGVNCHEGIGPITVYKNLLIEDSSFHNSNIGADEAGVYIGGGYVPALNGTIRRVYAYNNNWNGIHTNGVNLNTTITQSIAYNNGIAGFSLQSGTSNGTFTDNLAFGNLTDAFQIFSYKNGDSQAGTASYPITNASWSSGTATITVTGTVTVAVGNYLYITGNNPAGYDCLIGGCQVTAVSGQNISYAVSSDPGAFVSGGAAYIGIGDQTGNLIANNTFVVSNGNAAIVVSANDGGGNPVVGNLGGNTFRNNLLIQNHSESNNASYSPVWFNNAQGTVYDFFPSTLFDHNIFWNAVTGTGTAVMYKATGRGYDASGNPTNCTTNCGPSISWAGIGGMTNNTISNPKFTTYSTAVLAWTNPFQYDFHLQSASPAIGAGTSTGAPTYDLYGTPFSSPPNIGAVAGTATAGGGVAPTITTASLPGGTVGVVYSQTLTATGDTPITWGVTSGSLPAGLSLSGANISGTPSVSGTASFTVQAANVSGTDSKALSITIAPASAGVVVLGRFTGSVGHP